MNGSVEAHRDDLSATSAWHPNGSVDHRVFEPVIFEGIDILRYIHEQELMGSPLTQEELREVYNLAETVAYAGGVIPWETLVNPS